MTNKDGHCIILRCFVHIGNPCLSTSRPAGRMAGSITTGLPQLRQCMIASGDLRTRDQQLRISPLSLMSQLHGRWSSSRAYSQFMGTGGISHWNLGPWGGKSAANSLHGFFKLPLHYRSTAWRRWHHPHRPILTLAFWRHCCCSSAIISTPVNIFMNLKTFSSTSTVLAWTQRTDRRTDRQNCYINISMLTRDTNCNNTKAAARQSLNCIKNQKK